MGDDVKTPPPARPFTQFVQEQRRGALHEELSELLADVVAAVLEHGKGGSVKLALTIKPAGDGMVQIFDQLVAKKPEGEKAPSMFFVDKRGNVQRQDPRQQELPLTRVGAVAEAVGE